MRCTLPGDPPKRRANGHAHAGRVAFAQHVACHHFARHKKVLRRFAVEMHFACEPTDTGVELALRFGKSELLATVTEAHNPPARGSEHDRVPRQTESLVKDFKAMQLGVIQLDKGPGELSLQATKIPGKHGPEVRLLMLRRVP